jgi:putative ATPase
MIYMERVPLAERMRPQTLDEVIGQTHLLGDGEILRQIVRKKEPVSLILWGPPGSGKTTLARIIAKEVEADFIELSAVTSGKKDIEKVVEHARQNWNLQLRTVLFVDEVHRFNKAQQDAFLPHVESGLITLIGATTENPSFEVISPLLSRSRVLVLEPLTKDEIIAIIKHALKVLKQTKNVTPAGIDYLAELSGGDARVALGNLELALNMSAKKVTPDIVKVAAQKRVPGYDKKGEMHYNVISAFIKSMRGSDVDATLYYMARMIDAGEDPKFIARRMVIFASEDIGLGRQWRARSGCQCVRSSRTRRSARSKLRPVPLRGGTGSQQKITRSARSDVCGKRPGKTLPRRESSAPPTERADQTDERPWLQ